MTEHRVTDEDKVSDLSSRMARIEERVEMIREAQRVAKTEVDRRLEDMNELRRQIEGERGQYLSVARYEERHEDLGDRVDAIDRQNSDRFNALENRLSGIEGGSRIKAATVGWIIAGGGLFVTVIVVVVNLLTSA